MRGALSLACALVASSALVARADGGAAVENGFAGEVRLGTRFISVDGDAALSVGGPHGGFFVGYKVGRIVAGLGLDLERVAGGASGSMQADTSQSQTAVVFVPGVEITALRSADGRVDLFGELDFGIGHLFSDSNPNAAAGVDHSNYILSYLVGPGLRYWLTPHFAVAALAGLSGFFTAQSQSVQSPVGTLVTSSSTGVTSFFADLKLLAVF